jgi:hypothetical protein
MRTAFFALMPGITLPFFMGSALAHSASDAYLTLIRDAKTGLHGQWDIALRDLDFVLHLDADDDGKLTWAEVRAGHAAIARYAYAHLRLIQGGRECALVPQRMLIDAHADGAYAALFFDVHCATAPQAIALDYSLFFSVDPSHRAVLLMHGRGGIATSVLSPQNPRVDWPP